MTPSSSHSQASYSLPSYRITTEGKESEDRLSPCSVSSCENHRSPLPILPWPTDVKIGPGR
jgi:hypothetical protein